MDQESSNCLSELSLLSSFAALTIAATFEDVRERASCRLRSLIEHRAPYCLSYGNNYAPKALASVQDACLYFVLAGLNYRSRLSTLEMGCLRAWAL